MKNIIQNTIMNSTPIVLFVCFVAFEACKANKVLPGGSRHYGRLSRRQDSTPPPCNACTLSQLDEMPPALDFLNALGTIVKSSKDNFQNIFDSTFADPEELQNVIQQNLEYVQQATDAIIEEMSKDLENTESCPPLKTLFHSLRAQFDLFLSKLITKFDESVTDADPQTALAALEVAMAPDIPYYFELIRDLLIYCVDVYLTDNCEAIAPVIYTTLDPNGNIANDFRNALSSSGSAAYYLLTNIIGSLLPGDGGGALDYIHTLFLLLCGSVQVLQPGVDFAERTGNNCKDLPETFNYMNIIQNIVCGIAVLVDVDLLPSETVTFCNPTE